MAQATVSSGANAISTIDVVAIDRKRTGRAGTARSRC
jgi:hypothetical protein